MKNFKLWNTLCGWVVFAIAAVTYLMTIEPTASFWDCGEFISSAWKLDVGHPPGAPFFMLMGHFASLFASDISHVAMCVNALSALASAFTILFLFWTITALGKKLVSQAVDKGLQHMEFAKEDCTSLTYSDESFDAVTAAFGIRNFADLDKGLREMCRVLRKGGKLCIVELTTPVCSPMKQLFKVYSHTVLPLYGRLISGDASAYSYLTKTIEAFPQGERMMDILQQAGFANTYFKRLTFGICTMYIATKQ